MAFELKCHQRLAVHYLTLFPSAYESLDANRMTIVYFALAILDITKSERLKTDQRLRGECLDWIWAQQVESGGFRMGPFASAGGRSGSAADPAHLTATYSALLCLVILRDEDLLRKLNVPGLLTFVRSCQTTSGAFAAFPLAESDIRMTYCAAAVLRLVGSHLRPPSDPLYLQQTIDVSAAVGSVLNSQRYDGGFAQKPNAESQGGSTYCALATLSLLNSLDQLSSGKMKKLRRWLVRCQDGERGGFRGRPHKDADACYSFWTGASLDLLHQQDRRSGELMDRARNLSWLLACQNTVHGGISKQPDSNPGAYQVNGL